MNGKTLGWLCRWVAGRWLVGALIAGGMLPLMARAANCYVVPPGTPDAVPQDPYDDWSKAATNIQDAVNAAATNPACDTILVSNGTYALTGQIAVAIPVVLRSWNNGVTERDGTIINGGGVTRCFYIEDSGVVLDGFTVTNGAVNGSGAGIYLAGGGVLTNCLLTGNNAQTNGGGLYVAPSTTGLLANCEFAQNSAGNYGGGICVDQGAACDILACAIRNNTAAYSGGGLQAGVNGGDRVALNIQDADFIGNKSTVGSYSGGGMYLVYVDLAASRCSIVSNVAQGYGGGISIRYVSGLMEDCDIITNQSLYSASYSYGGGGIYMYRSDPVVRDCRIIGNYSALIGGGIQTYQSGLLTSSALIDRCLVVSNFALNVGGGISLYTSDVHEDTVPSVVRSCLIAWNKCARRGAGVSISTNGVVENCTIVSNYTTRGDSMGAGLFVGKDQGLGPGEVFCMNDIIELNHTGGGISNNWAIYTGSVPVFSNCCSTPSLASFGGGNIESDPLFVDIDGCNYRLAAGSPCIDRGLTLDWMLAPDALDMDANPRVFGYGRRVDMGAYERWYSGSFFSIR